MAEQEPNHFDLLAEISSLNDQNIKLKATIDRQAKDIQLLNSQLYNLNQEKL